MEVDKNYNDSRAYEAITPQADISFETGGPLRTHVVVT
jgi:hypothetical protein